MTGLEVLVAIFTILSSFATCSEYVGEVMEKVKKKTARAQGERFVSSLRNGHLAIQNELDNLRILNAIAGLGHVTPGQSLVEAQRTIESLKSLLQLLALQNDVGLAPNFSRYQTLADRSRNLTLESLHQLTGLLPAASSTRLLLPGPTSSLVSASAGAPLIRLNIHDICRNARLFRKNLFDFEQLTNEGLGSNNQEWHCKHCSLVISQAALRLSPSSDKVWVSAAGMLKAHCQRKLGQPDGWTCIWPVVSTECYVRFNSEKQLLQHMKSIHVKLGSPGEKTRIHWPADIRYRSPETCGFGATIGGQVMQNSASCFIVPPSAIGSV